MSKIAFQADMKDLRRAVNYVRNALGTSKTDLSVMIVRMELKGTALSLFAFDKEVFAKHTITVRNTGGGDGPFAIMGNKLEKLVSAVDSETVSMDVDAENVEVRAGFLVVNFELYDEAQLRTAETQLVAEHASLQGASLSKFALEEGLVCAKSCTTSNSVRPDVTHAEIRGGRLLSSDGRKIMIYMHRAIPEGVKLKVPAVAMNGMIGILKNMEAEEAMVKEGKSYFYVSSMDGAYISGVRKVEREFPPVEGQIVAQANPTDDITVDKVMLEAMINGVALGLASDEVRVDITVSGEKGDATLEVSTVNSVGRRSYEKTSCGRKGTGLLTMPVSYKHLADTLGVFKGDSVVDMFIMVEKSILMVKDHTEDREVMTVIPFRTQEAVNAEKREREAAEKVKTDAKAALEAKEKAEGEKKAGTVAAEALAA